MSALQDKVFSTLRTFRRKDVEAFGVTVQLRQLSAAAFKDIGLRTQNADPAIHNNVFWVIGCTFDPETNERLFSWADIERVNELFVGDINALAEQAIALNTGGQKSEKDIEKNSEASPT